jgi:hypothetical protein
MSDEHAPLDRPEPRTMPAGHALVIVIGALLIGLFLNAGDIRQTAARQEFGPLRTVALALADPVADVADAVGLDVPRNAIDSVLGRAPSDPGEPDGGPVADGGSSATTTTTTATTTPAGGVSTTAPTSTTTSTVPVEVRRVPSESDPLRMYVGGDSMVGQFGPMLQNRAGRTGLVETTVDYEFESGLTRPDFIDWPARLATVAEDVDPEVVVLFFGGNDAQAIQLSDGSWVDFGTDVWLSEYRSRVASVMEQLIAEGRDVYWIGMPIVRSETFRERLRILNGIYESEAAAHDGVTYVASWPVFTGPDGDYSEYLPNADGDVVDMRLNDGVHLTTAGAILLADVVFEVIDGNWGLEAAAGG